MMQRRRLAIAFGLLVCLSGAFMGRAEARPVHIDKTYETEKVLGVGVLLGVPLSISGKFFLNSEWAVDVGAGAYLAYRDRSGLHVHADILWHPFVAVEGETFMAPLYVGLGTRFLQYDEMDQSVTHVGVRVPVGIAFDFNDEPYDLFLEGAVVFDPVVSESGPSPLDMNFGAGARIFF